VKPAVSRSSSAKGEKSRNAPSSARKPHRAIGNRVWLGRRREPACCWGEKERGEQGRGSKCLGGPKKGHQPKYSKLEEKKTLNTTNEASECLWVVFGVVCDGVDTVFLWVGYDWFFFELWV